MAAADYADLLQPGDHGSTFAGGPLVCSAALAVLEIVDDPALLRRVRELGAELRERLLGLEGVAEVRGRGLMIGIGLREGIDATEVAARALEAGLVINVPEPGSLRMLPPLTIGEDEVDRATALLANAVLRAGGSR